MTDNSGASVGAGTAVNVKNVAPVISASASISATPNLLAAGSATTVTVNVPFTDVGTLDTHTCSISWDDTTSSSTAVTETGGSGSCTGTLSHTYSSPGVYTLKVTVTDDDTGSSTFTSFEYVVVYDPNAGFVTGGGWIMSPLNAYLNDPSLTGKATFGFVSKYKNGASTPTGETEFQFHAATFNFKSTSYEWLVVSGAKAQYKGSGTVNGSTGPGGQGYGFLLTATDGALLPGGGTDKFRIKIWEKATGAVVYDNKRGTLDDIDAADPQDVAGGSIVIHKK